LEDDLGKLGVNPTHRPAANPLSLVVVLSVALEGKTFSALLGADTEASCLEKALNSWRQQCSAKSLQQDFNVIKVPHHGSKKSHLPRICTTRHQDGLNVAAISVGATRPVLPDRLVLADYLQAGWQVMATTTKGGRTSPTHPMMLISRSKAVPAKGPRSHLIHLAWTPTSGLSAEPDEAIIGPNELPLYETAKS